MSAVLRTQSLSKAFGAFIIYALMVLLLIAFPRGLFGRRA